MAGRWDCFQGLPHGWEAKFDFRTGRYYFLDHINTQTTWEDPRLKSCPPPPPHPDTIPPEMRINQTATVAPLVGGWGSPILGGRYVGLIPSVGGMAVAHLPPYALYGPVYPSQDVINFRGSCLPVVPGLPTGGVLSSKDLDNDLDVAKISAMFPTVPEARIKELLKKYHQRTAVVISALQVAKYPLATPGPYGTFTPPPARHFLPAAATLAAFQSTAHPSLSTAGAAAAVLPSTRTSSSISTASTVLASSPQKGQQQRQQQQRSSFSGAVPHSYTSATPTPPPPIHPSAQTASITSVTAIPISAAPLSFSNSSRPSTPERTQLQSRASYERVRGTHLLERIGSIGDQSMMGGSLGSPRMSTRGSSPHTTRSTSEVTRSLISSPRATHSPRPSPHSPKIKLRYLKGLFPSVDPTIVLDVLTQCSYNVKDACETLVSRGHHKKETVFAPPQLKEASLTGTPKASPKPSPAPTRPKFLSETANRIIRQRLADTFPDVTPTVLRMALQSVGHDEDLARAVLAATRDDGRGRRPGARRGDVETPGDVRRRAVTDQVGPTPERGAGERLDGAALRLGRTVRPALPRPRVNFAWTHTVTHTSPSWSVDVMEEDGGVGRRARGPDPALHRGPCDHLLLTDYTPWHGPNSDNASGSLKSLAKGPNMTLRRGASNCIARGPNTTLVKGAGLNLAKGSIFSQALKKDSPPSSKRL